MYVLVNQFMLIKPAIDLHNVPEFYKLFFSSSMEVSIEVLSVLIHQQLKPFPILILLLFFISFSF